MRDDPSTEPVGHDRETRRFDLAAPLMNLAHMLTEGMLLPSADAGIGETATWAGYLMDAARELTGIDARPAAPGRPGLAQVILRICDATVTPPTGGHGLNLEDLAVILRGESEATSGGPSGGVMNAVPSTVAAWAYVLGDLPEVRDGVRWFFEAAEPYGIKPVPVERCDPRNRPDWESVRRILGTDD